MVLFLTQAAMFAGQVWHRADMQHQHSSSVFTQPQTAAADGAAAGAQTELTWITNYKFVIHMKFSLG